MENVVLTIHLILALLLIVIVLLQRSEGGGLGMGGGGAVSGRAAATALGKITWVLATGFIITSITLTILAASSSNGRSVIDQLGGTVPTQAPETAPALGGDLLPPSATDAPAAPPAAPATPPAAPAN